MSAPAATPVPIQELPMQKSPSLKERVEGHPVVFFLGALLAGFLAGLAVVPGAMKILSYSAIPQAELDRLKASYAPAASAPTGPTAVRLWTWAPSPSELETLRGDATKSALENYHAGIAHYLRREYAEADRAFLRAQGDESIAPFAVNRQANVQRVLKNYAEAAALYLKAINLANTVRNPEDRTSLLTNSWHDRGWTLRRIASTAPDAASQGKEWLAIQALAQKAFLEAASINPRFAKAWHNAAQVSLDRGEYQQAKVFSISAFSFDPEYYRPAYNLAWIATREGDESQALSWLERALQIDAAQVYAAEASGAFAGLQDKARLKSIFDEAKSSVADSSRSSQTAVGRQPQQPAASSTR